MSIILDLVGGKVSVVACRNWKEILSGFWMLEII